jgi:dTDP-4-dehydrorhamnose reductase
MDAAMAVLGAQGQLGRELQSLLSGEDFKPLTRQDADLAIPGQITALLHAIKPKIVINCSAYNLVDQCEATPEAGFSVNAFGVRELALTCRDIDATLVHFSTDYVFGLEGFRPTPYLESDAPGPVSAYGLSKLTGEYFIRSTCPKHFVIRTCGLYGRFGVGGKGTNFVETMLKLAHAGKSIKVVEDQILTPSSARDVAQGAIKLIGECPFGLYHLTNAGQCSWYEFAQTIFKLAQVNADLHPTTTAAYGAKALRPAYSVLGTEHQSTPRLRSWRDALADYIKCSSPL